MLLQENFFKKVYPILLENGFQPPKKNSSLRAVFLSVLISSILATIMDAKKRKGMYPNYSTELIKLVKHCLNIRRGT